MTGMLPTVLLQLIHDYLAHDVTLTTKEQAIALAMELIDENMTWSASMLNGVWHNPCIPSVWFEHLEERKITINWIELMNNTGPEIDCKFRMKHAHKILSSATSAATSALHITIETLAFLRHPSWRSMFGRVEFVRVLQTMNAKTLNALVEKIVMKAWPECYETYDYEFLVTLATKMGGKIALEDRLLLANTPLALLIKHMNSTDFLGDYELSNIVRRRDLPVDFILAHQQRLASSRDVMREFMCNRHFVLTSMLDARVLTIFDKYVSHDFIVEANYTQCDDEHVMRVVDFLKTRVLPNQSRRRSLWHSVTKNPRLAPFFGETGQLASMEKLESLFVERDFTGLCDYVKSLDFRHRCNNEVMQTFLAHVVLNKDKQQQQRQRQRQWKRQHQQQENEVVYRSCVQALCENKTVSLTWIQNYESNIDEGWLSLCSRTDLSTEFITRNMHRICHHTSAMEGLGSNPFLPRHYLSLLVRKHLMNLT